jgi:Mrp family chromosome partitioning ATPase
MRTLIKEASEIYSFVVVDSPPLLNVADSRILASLVDSTVLVVKCGDTPRQAVQFAESQARAAGADILGVVLNNIDARAADYPYHGFRPASDTAPQN